MKFNIKNKLSQLCTALLGVTMLFNTSCDSFLDVRPVGEIPSDQLLSSAAGFESAIFGVYGSMNANSLYGKNLSHDLIDILAQYYVCQGNLLVDNIKTYNYNYADVETTLASIWGDMYKNIANVNNIILSLDKINPNTFRHYNLYKGEALGLRAFMHFDLLRLYTAHIQNNPSAEGIPYSIKFELSPSSFSSASKVYELIEADLLKAEELLAKDAEYFTFPKVNPTEPFLRDRETHFNLYAVQATLARLYLTKGDKVKAATYAKKVVDSQKFKLIDKGDFANNLPKGTLYPTETVFGLYNINNFPTVKPRFYDNQTYFSYNLRADLIDTYKQEQQPIDYRIGSFFNDVPLGADTVKRFVKLVDPYLLRDQVYLRPAGLLEGVILIRLPEMYYVLAESLMESNPTEAMKYFNTAIESRGLSGLSDRQPALPLNLYRITTERYKEMIGEGQTFFNMKRLNLPIRNTEGTLIPASNQIYVWPIPNDEKEFNN